MPNIQGNQIPQLPPIGSSFPLPDIILSPPPIQYTPPVSRPVHESGHSYDEIARQKLSQTEKSELISELSRAVSDPTSTLERTGIQRGRENNIDYDSFLRKQFDREFRDYFEAGRKFQEAGLTNSSAISFACAIFSGLLSAGEVFAAESWERVLQEYQDRNAPIITVIMGLFDGIAHRSKSKIYSVINALKKIEGFSVDDLELVKNTIEYLNRRAAAF
jgi:hypothetical protein